LWACLIPHLLTKNMQNNTYKPLKLITHRLFKGFQSDHHSIKHIYQHKKTTYGDFTEIRDYKKIKCSFISPKVSYDKNQQKPRSDFSISRSKQRIFQIIEANHEKYDLFRTVFLTPTFKDQSHERKITDRRIHQFCRRLSYYLGYKVEYLFVTERHKSGAIHYHGLIFNMPFIPIKYLEKNIYKYGSLDIDIPSNIRSVTRYVSKYITKDLIKNIDKNKKCYISSRGLVFPSSEFGFFNPDPDMLILNQVDYPKVKITKYKNAKM